MKNKFYPVCIILIAANAVVAQKIEGIAAFIQSGYLNAPNTKNFNQVYPANTFYFDNNYLVLGTTGLYRNSKNMFIGEWQFGLQKTHSFSNEHASIVYETILGKYGKIIKEERNYWLYPSAGVGASVISLANYNKVGYKKEDIITQTLVSPTFDVGLNADFLLSKKRRNENYYLGWICGMKAGYRFSIKSHQWQKDEDKFYKDAVNKTYEMPSYTNNAFYITLSFGGGSFDKK